MRLKKTKLKTIFRSLRNGTSILAACKGADIEASTLWRWRQAFPKLDERIKQIIDSRIQVVEDALFKSATEGNTTSIIFFLMNRAPDRWADKRALVQNNIVNKSINNPLAAYNDKELDDLVAGIIQRKEETAPVSADGVGAPQAA